MITLVFSPKYPLPSNLHTTVCWKSVQLDRVAFFRSDFFQNWYFSTAFLCYLTRFTCLHVLKLRVKETLIKYRSEKVGNYSWQIHAKYKFEQQFLTSEFVIMDFILHQFLSRPITGPPRQIFARQDHQSGGHITGASPLQLQDLGLACHCGPALNRIFD